MREPLPTDGSGRRAGRRRPGRRGAPARRPRRALARDPDAAAATARRPAAARVRRPALRRARGSRSPSASPRSSRCSSAPGQRLRAQLRAPMRAAGASSLDAPARLLASGGAPAVAAKAVALGAERRGGHRRYGRRARDARAPSAPQAPDAAPADRDARAAAGRRPGGRCRGAARRAHHRVNRDRDEVARGLDPHDHPPRRRAARGQLGAGLGGRIARRRRPPRRRYRSRCSSSRTAAAPRTRARVAATAAGATTAGWTSAGDGDRRRLRAQRARRLTSGFTHGVARHRRLTQDSAIGALGRGDRIFHPGERRVAAVRP